MVTPMVRVSLKDLWKSSNIDGLQAASKAFIQQLRSKAGAALKNGQHLFSNASASEWTKIKNNEFTHLLVTTSI